MSDTFDPTPDQIVAGINQALADRELAIVPGLIRLLAVKDPHRAQAVLDAIEIARVVRS
jgi:hypothetical protein